MFRAVRRLMKTFRIILPGTIAPSLFRVSTTPNGFKAAVKGSKHARRSINNFLTQVSNTTQSHISTVYWRLQQSIYTSSHLMLPSSLQSICLFAHSFSIPTFCSEFGLVQQAYYTEPSDQSGWLYHRWLLGRVVATGAANQLPVLGISIGTHLFEEKHQQSNIDQRTQEIESSTNSSSSSLFTLSSLDWHLTVFTRELQSVSELLEIEPDCKPALLTAAILQAGIIACRHQSGADASTQDEVTQLTSNIKEKFDRLIQLDPMRTNYYRDVRQRFIN